MQMPTEDDAFYETTIYKPPPDWWYGFAAQIAAEEQARQHENRYVPTRRQRITDAAWRFRRRVAHAIAPGCDCEDC
jgi:hypothetical protein